MKRFSQIKILPNLWRQDLYDKFYSQIDYLIIPSVWEETGPMTLFEAFYYKIPVIISNRPSMVEKTIEGVNALVFDNTRTLGGIMKDIIEARVTPAVKSRTNFPVKTLKEYAAILEKIYSGKHLIPKLEHE
jgi:glycosyltransferase involved in cell wall biosynthesis